MRCRRRWSTGVGFRPEVKVLGIDPKRRRPAVWFLGIPVGRLGGHGWSLERHCGMRRTGSAMETRRCVSEKVTDDLCAPSKLCHRAAVSGVMPWMPRWMPCGHWRGGDGRLGQLSRRTARARTRV